MSSRGQRTHRFTAAGHVMLASVKEGRWDGGGLAFGMAWADLEFLRLGDLATMADGIIL